MNQTTQKILAWIIQTTATEMKATEQIQNSAKSGKKKEKS